MLLKDVVLSVKKINDIENLESITLKEIRKYNEKPDSTFILHLQYLINTYFQNVNPDDMCYKYLSTLLTFIKFVSEGIDDDYNWDLTKQEYALLLESCLKSARIYLKTNPTRFSFLFHIVCDTAQLLASKSQIIRNALLKEMSVRLLKLLVHGFVLTQVKFNVSKVLIQLLNDLDEPLKSELYRKVGKYLFALAMCLHTVGDFITQCDCVEVIFRYTSGLTEAMNKIARYFLNPELQDQFLSVQNYVFEIGCRKFLNSLNKMQGSNATVFTLTCLHLFMGQTEVFKPEDPEYTDFWVDVNVGMRRITFICDANSLKPEGEAAVVGWELIVINSQDVEQFQLLPVDNGAADNAEVVQLKLRLINACKYIHETSRVVVEKTKVVTFYIKSSDFPPELKNIVLPNMFVGSDLGSESDRTKIQPKQNIMARSGKMNSNAKRANVPSRKTGVQRLKATYPSMKTVSNEEANKENLKSSASDVAGTQFTSSADSIKEMYRRLSSHQNVKYPTLPLCKKVPDLSQVTEVQDSQVSKMDKVKHFSGSIDLYNNSFLESSLSSTVLNDMRRNVGGDRCTEKEEERNLARENKVIPKNKIQCILDDWNQSSLLEDTVIINAKEVARMPPKGDGGGDAGTTRGGGEKLGDDVCGSKAKTISSGVPGKKRSEPARKTVAHKGKLEDKKPSLQSRKAGGRLRIQRTPKSSESKGSSAGSNSKDGELLKKVSRLSIQESPITKERVTVGGSHGCGNLARAVPSKTCPETEDVDAQKVQRQQPSGAQNDTGLVSTVADDSIIIESSLPNVRPTAPTLTKPKRWRGQDVKRGCVSGAVDPSKRDNDSAIACHEGKQRKDSIPPLDTITDCHVAPQPPDAADRQSFQMSQTGPFSVGGGSKVESKSGHRTGKLSETCDPGKTLRSTRSSLVKVRNQIGGEDNLCEIRGQDKTSHGTRSSLARAMKEIGGDDNLSEIHDLDKTSHGTRSRLVKAMNETGGEDNLFEIHDMDKTSHGTRSHLVKAMNETGGEGNLSEKYLDDASHSTRSHLVKAMNEIGGKGNLAETPDPDKSSHDTRSRLAKAMNEIGGKGNLADRRSINEDVGKRNGETLVNVSKDSSVTQTGVKPKQVSSAVSKFPVHKESLSNGALVAVDMSELNRTTPESETVKRNYEQPDSDTSSIFNIIFPKTVTTKAGDLYQVSKQKIVKTTKTVESVITLSGKKIAAQSKQQAGGKGRAAPRKRKLFSLNEGEKSKTGVTQVNWSKAVSSTKLSKEMKSRSRQKVSRTFKKPSAAGRNQKKKVPDSRKDGDDPKLSVFSDFSSEEVTTPDFLKKLVRPISEKVRYMSIDDAGTFSSSDEIFRNRKVGKQKVKSHKKEAEGTFETGMEMQELRREQRKQQWQQPPFKNTSKISNRSDNTSVSMNNTFDTDKVDEFDKLFGTRRKSSKNVVSKNTVEKKSVDAKRVSELRETNNVSHPKDSNQSNGTPAEGNGDEISGYGLKTHQNVTRLGNKLMENLSDDSDHPQRQPLPAKAMKKNLLQRPTEKANPNLGLKPMMDNPTSKNSQNGLIKPDATTTKSHKIRKNLLEYLYSEDTPDGDGGRKSKKQKLMMMPPLQHGEGSQDGSDVIIDLMSDFSNKSAAAELVLEDPAKLKRVDQENKQDTAKGHKIKRNILQDPDFENVPYGHDTNKNNKNGKQKLMTAGGESQDCSSDIIIELSDLSDKSVCIGGPVLENGTKSKCANQESKLGSLTKGYGKLDTVTSNKIKKNIYDEGPYFEDVPGAKSNKKQKLAPPPPLVESQDYLDIIELSDLSGKSVFNGGPVLENATKSVNQPANKHGSLKVYSKIDPARLQTESHHVVGQEEERRGKVAKIQKPAAENSKSGSTNPRALQDITNKYDLVEENLKRMFGSASQNSLTPNTDISNVSFSMGTNISSIKAGKEFGKGKGQPREPNCNAKSGNDSSFDLPNTVSQVSVVSGSNNNAAARKKVKYDKSYSSLRTCVSLVSSLAAGRNVTQGRSTTERNSLRDATTDFNPKIYNWLADKENYDFGQTSKTLPSPTKKTLPPFGGSKCNGKGRKVDKGEAKSKVGSHRQSKGVKGSTTTKKLEKFQSKTLVSNNNNSSSNNREVISHVAYGRKTSNVVVEQRRAKCEDWCPGLEDSSDSSVLSISSDDGTDNSLVGSSGTKISSELQNVVNSHLKKKFKLVEDYSTHVLTVLQDNLKNMGLNNEEKWKLCVAKYKTMIDAQLNDASEIMQSVEDQMSDLKNVEKFVKQISQNLEPKLQLALEKIHLLQQTNKNMLKELSSLNKESLEAPNEMEATMEYFQSVIDRTVAQQSVEALANIRRTVSRMLGFE